MSLSLSTTSMSRSNEPMWLRASNAMPGAHGAVADDRHGAARRRRACCGDSHAEGGAQRRTRMPDALTIVDVPDTAGRHSKELERQCCILTRRANATGA